MKPGWQKLLSAPRRAGGEVRLPGLVVLAGIVLVVAGLALHFWFGNARQPMPWMADNWVATWGASPGTPKAGDVQVFNDQTLRLIVHTTIGGKKVRVRVSNELGTAPLRIGAAHVALRQDGASIAAGTDRALTFGGAQSITIPAGAPVLSDPVDLDVPRLADLAVSLYLPGKAQATTIHAWASQTSYVSPTGNFAGAGEMPAERTITSWPFLSEVDVAAPEAVAIVALGDSITEAGTSTIDANQRWPDLLAARLLGEAGKAGAGSPGGQLGVVNRGISGNRLLRDPHDEPLYGKAGLARFDREVLATAGVRYLIVLIGINDIGHPGFGKVSPAEAPATADLIAGYRQLIARAHEKGIAVYGATMTPFEGTVHPGWYTPQKGAVRDAVNAWIRNSGEFDGVIDFDRALRDPAHPGRLLAVYDRGDHLHPNDLGMQALAKAIPVDLFRLHKAGQWERASR
jgi:lysophospholipase L1-like esterase